MSRGCHPEQRQRKMHLHHSAPPCLDSEAQLLLGLGLLLSSSFGEAEEAAKPSISALSTECTKQFMQSSVTSKS